MFGTCAGMILLATDVLDGRPDQARFGAIDITVRATATAARSTASRPTSTCGLDRRTPVPWCLHPRPEVVVSEAGVEVLAEYEGVPVLLRSGRGYRCVVPSRAGR